uniref:Uncharacterized protein n=1 Tax=Rhizophora mucronata TaxID=61149 RepID=A0A2P2PME6_RHIMU
MQKKKKTKKKIHAESDVCV